ncbi:MULTISPECIES: PD-(D/E)XK nuclease family protein [unclassified Streptomyces]|uniref:PD-(D/E)XK nuclease family protein n=1 Tax=unclassified Streptomyces TaxID=2593676 RepID=UPI0022AE6149|nr:MULTISPECIES: PD-(D/E)XK nuclease family protein [unclassified Streptomyces]MCZ4097324.1 PD-(D/E)XK nuclease family protein [Streptomyces sp. H39-C1]MCZ4120628.1 PD-(D/E)XK nuclease family protein [Streptomyces sp. H39-S7]
MSVFWARHLCGDTSTRQRVEGIGLPISTTAPKRRSHSQYNSYSQCGEAYKLERVDRKPSDPAGWFVQGSAVHYAVECYELSGRTLSTSQTIARYREKWDADMAAGLAVQPDVSKWRTGGFKSGTKDLADRYDLGEHQVADYVSYTETSTDTIWTTPDGRLAIELQFDIMVGTVPVRGFIDQIVSTAYGLSVRDVKTGTKKQSSALQLALYRRAIWETYRIDVIWGDFFTCARKGRSPRAGGPTDPIDLTTIDQHWLEQQYAAMDAAERNGVYLANPGDHCTVCGVQKFCKAKGN